jgi:hypothetical protein
LSGRDTLLTKSLISARASRSKVETRRQLLHRIPEQALSIGDIGCPVLGGEVVGVVGDELECAPGDGVVLTDMGDREQFHVDDVDVVLVEPRIARCDEAVAGSARHIAIS